MTVNISRLSRRSRGRCSSPPTGVFAFRSLARGLLLTSLPKQPARSPPPGDAPRSTTQAMTPPRHPPRRSAPAGLGGRRRRAPVGNAARAGTSTAATPLIQGTPSPPPRPRTRGRLRTISPPPAGAESQGQSPGREEGATLALRLNLAPLPCSSHWARTQESLICNRKKLNLNRHSF